MSSRPILTPYSVITNASMATNVTSVVTIVQNLSMISYDISWSAGSSLSGTFSIQVSNTYSQNAAGGVANAGNWSTLTLSSSPTASGATGNGFIDVEATGAYAMRLVYTSSAGTGTLNATISAKVA